MTERVSVQVIKQQFKHFTHLQNNNKLHQP